MFINSKHELADQLLRSGDIKGALAVYNELIIAFPENPVLFSDRGVVHLHLNEQQKCLDDLTTAVTLQPDYAYRYASRAFALGHFKQFDLAIADYEKAIELDPEDAISENNLGLILEQKGYHDAAKIRFERADKLSKAESHLHDLMNELEDQSAGIEKGSDHNEAVPEVKTSEPSSQKEELKKIFTSRQQFREFMRFVKNGFKIK